MRTQSKKINHPDLNKDHHRAVATYLLGSAAYENIFEHYSSKPYTPISDFTSVMRDVVLEGYYNMLMGSKSPVDDFANTVRLFENLRYFMKDYDILVQELRSDHGMRKIIHYATMITQAVDQLKGGEL